MKKLVITILCASFATTSFSQERKELRKNSPNRIVLNIGAGVFSNYTYDWNDDNSDWDDPNFNMGNVTYSGMLGYRSGFNSDNYKFSSTGRDANRGNVVALFYQGGSINAEGLAGLNKDEMKYLFDVQSITEFESDNFNVRFGELQVGVIWREFLRISGGRGFVKPIHST